MFALVLVLVLHASVALRPAHLKPGALTRDLGRVYLVEGINARNLTSTLWRLKKEFPNDSLQSGVMLSLLHVQIQYVNDTITSALENYRGLTVTNRTKRGLIDGIGKLSQMLFGTAMNEDVVELRDKYNQLVNVTKANNKAINLNCRNIARLEKQVAELAAYTNLLHIILFVFTIHRQSVLHPLHGSLSMSLRNVIAAYNFPLEAFVKFP